MALSVTPATASADANRAVAELSREFRSAVLAEDHARAEQVASCYADALRNLWESLPESERAVSPLPAKARELLLWARHTTLIQRGLKADQLAVLEIASHYQFRGIPHAVEVKA